MPPLRITTGLSLLALLLGVLGTSWLSVRSGQWAGPRHAVVAVHTAPPARSYRQVSREWHPPPRVIGSERLAVASVAPAGVTPELVPLAMPQLQARYDNVRGHLQGSLVLALTVGADGNVLASAVSRSSGDPVLDAHAQRLVSRWRFAVPADHPHGVRGQLPMHFGATDGMPQSP